MKKGFSSIEEYLWRFKALYDSLTATKRHVDDTDKVFQLARGLVAEYWGFQVAILVKPPTPSFNQFVAALQGINKCCMLKLMKKKHVNHEHAISGQRGKGKLNGDGFIPKIRGGFQHTSRPNDSGNGNQNQ